MKVLNIHITSHDRTFVYLSQSLLVDHQALLYISLATEKLVDYDLGEQKTSLPLFLSGIPAHFCHALVPPLQRSQIRRRGKHSDLLVNDPDTVSWK